MTRLQRISLYIFTLFFPVLFSHALDASDFSINLSPESPSPGETVTVSVSSYLFNTDSADFVWKKNGTSFLSGTGESSLSFKTPPLGKKDTIDLTITSEGSIFTQSFVVEPFDIDILWEAPESYTPPFYKGKALPIAGADIRTAIFVNNPKTVNEKDPSKNTYWDPYELVYKWKRNGKVSQGGSGFGKSGFTLTHDILGKREFLEGEITSKDGSFFVKKSKNLVVYSPQIIYYPVFGSKPDLHKGYTGTLETLASSLTLSATPFFFSDVRTDLQNGILHTWNFDGTNLESSTGSRIVTVEPQTAGTRLTYAANHVTKLLQSLSQEILILKK